MTVEGLGTLRNRIASSSSINPTIQQITKQSAITPINAAKSLGTDIGLTKVNGKPLNYKHQGSGKENIVFVHGLGGTLHYWSPLISTLSLDTTHSLHLFDLEGHGLSPTHPLSDLTVESFAADLRGIFDLGNISELNPAVLVAHSMGCLVAMRFVLDNPQLVKKLVLVGPPPSPLPSAASEGTFARAALVRAKGMNAVAQTVVNAGTSERSKKHSPLAIAAITLSLLGQDPEAYAKACWALARAQQALDLESVKTKTLIITGDEDKVSPPKSCEGYVGRIGQSQLTVLKETGHWHVYESLVETSQAIKDFL